MNVTSDRVSKIVSSLKKKEYIEVKLKFRTDSKEVESRQIIPNKEKINRYSEKYLEGIGENNYLDSQKQLYPIGENNKDIINNIKNNYLDSQKQLYPIGENNKDIINNIKNKKIYNNSSNSNKKYKLNYKERDYTNFDFTKLYANADAFV